MRSDTENIGGLGSAVLVDIERLAERHDISSVILFGSRARGDYRPKSDIDLALRGGDARMFALDAQDELPTLLSIDFVNLNEPVQKQLSEEIAREGVPLYEKVR